MNKAISFQAFPQMVISTERERSFIPKAGPPTVKEFSLRLPYIRNGDRERAITHATISIRTVTQGKDIHKCLGVMLYPLEPTTPGPSFIRRGKLKLEGSPLMKGRSKGLGKHTRHIATSQRVINITSVPSVFHPTIFIIYLLASL